MRASRFETDYFYIVLTYGRFHGGAAELAEKFVSALGIRPAYINVILMVGQFPACPLIWTRSGPLTKRWRSS